MPISKEVKDYVKRLKDNDPTLTSIDLQYNHIGDDGARELAAALKSNQTLIH